MWCTGFKNTWTNIPPSKNCPPTKAEFVPSYGTRQLMKIGRKDNKEILWINMPALFCFLEWTEAFIAARWEKLEIGVRTYCIAKKKPVPAEQSVCQEWIHSFQNSLQLEVIQGHFLSHWIYVCVWLN